MPKPILLLPMPLYFYHHLHPNHLYQHHCFCSSIFHPSHAESLLNVQLLLKGFSLSLFSTHLQLPCPEGRKMREKILAWQIKQVHNVYIFFIIYFIMSRTHNKSRGPLVFLYIYFVNKTPPPPLCPFTYVLPFLLFPRLKNNIIYTCVRACMRFVYNPKSSYAIRLTDTCISRGRNNEVG